MPENIGEYDIVYCVGPKDREIVQVSIESVRRFVNNYRRIYLISRKPLKIDGCIDVSEMDPLFPFSLEDVNSIIQVPERSPWYYQQLLKFHAKQGIPDLLTKYLVVDSDTIFLRPMNFLQGEKYCVNCTSLENHRPYFEWMLRLHPEYTKQIQESGVCHHFLFDQAILNELQQRVEEYHGRLFWKIFLEMVDQRQRAESGASEYELYFNYLLKFHPSRVLLHKLPFASLSERIDKSNWMNYISTRNEFYINSHWWNRHEQDLPDQKENNSLSCSGIEESEIITGERLQQFCDITILTQEIHRFHTSLPQTVKRLFLDTDSLDDILSVLNDSSVRSIFVYTHILNEFIEKVWKGIAHPVVVMTHNSDGVINESFREWIQDPKLIHLFSQNLLIVDPKATAIPIGLANAMWPHGDTRSISNFTRKNNELQKNDRIAVNFRVGTYIQHRCNVMRDLFRNACYNISTNLPTWMAYQEIQKCGYCACPRGNGPDTHRLWESLYLGCIPLVDAGVGAEQFTDLPMILVSDWRNVHLECGSKANANWNKLKLSWWRRCFEEKTKKYRNKEEYTSRTADACSFVLSYQGFLPDYLEVCLRQILFWSPNVRIYVAYENKSANQERITRWGLSGVHWIDLANLERTSWHNMFVQHYRNLSMNGFWRFATERFFFVEEVMKQYRLRDVIHLEADNLIYFDLKKEIDHFRKVSESTRILCPSDNDSRYIAGLCFIPSSESVSRLNQYFALRSRHEAEMEQMMRYGELYTLPVVPKAYAGDYKPMEGTQVFNRDRLYRFAEEFDGLFDAAALGQYLGGIDKIHNPGNTDGFINPHSAYRINEMEVRLGDLREPYLRAKEESKWWRVFNLHIHSKELSRFASYSETT